MAKGQARKESVWDSCVRHLQQERSMFRMAAKEGSPYIWIKELRDGRTVRRFSSKHFRIDDDAQIRKCMQACLACHRDGVWDRSIGGELNDTMTWEAFARLVTENLRSRVQREGSRKNAEGHLKQIAKFRGVVNSNKLLDWVMERSPITQPHAYRNRIETLSHIQKAKSSTGLDVSLAIKAAKDERPTGAAKKEQEARTQEIHAIPTDAKLEKWLKRLSGHEQWLCALIATYGLRPSEAWHAERIDEDGWIVIPGDGKTKTKRHIAPPVPSRWLDEFNLQENFERYQREVNNRWKIIWSEGDNPIPLNNSKVSNAFWRLMYRDGIPRLWVEDEWVRPYDLRHAYAIRCFDSEETIGKPPEDFARWMGHGLDVHERVYLKHMSATREDAAVKARYALAKPAAPKNEPEPEGVFISKEEYEKIQAIKAMLGS